MIKMHVTELVNHAVKSQMMKSQMMVMMLMCVIPHVAPALNV
jgi:hypothetical protein